MAARPARPHLRHRLAEIAAAGPAAPPGRFRGAGDVAASRCSGRTRICCPAGTCFSWTSARPKPRARRASSSHRRWRRQMQMPLEEHDRVIAYVLGLSHALNIAFFTALAESGEAARGSQTFRARRSTPSSKSRRGSPVKIRTCTSRSRASIPSAFRRWRTCNPRWAG